MKPKSPRKKLIKELDDLFSAHVRQRDKKCFICGSEKVFTHHIFGRRNMSVRWDDDNGISICWPHHRNMAHGDPLVFRRHLMELKGEKWLSDLEARARKVKKYDVSELEVLIQEMKKAAM